MNGPYVSLAAICEQVLIEQDGVLSAIRMVDRLQVVVKAVEPGVVVPDELPPGQVTFKLAVALKSGDAKGRHRFRVQTVLPDERRLPTQEVDVLFEGEDRGVNIIMDIGIEAMEGVTWTELWIGDRILTKVPLRVTYQRVTGA